MDKGTRLLLQIRVHFRNALCISPAYRATELCMLTTADKPERPHQVTVLAGGSEKAAHAAFLEVDTSGGDQDGHLSRCKAQAATQGRPHDLPGSPDGPPAGVCAVDERGRGIRVREAPRRPGFDLLTGHDQNATRQSSHLSSPCGHGIGGSESMDECIPRMHTSIIALDHGVSRVSMSHMHLTMDSDHPGPCTNREQPQVNARKDGHRSPVHPVHLTTTHAATC